MGALTGHRSARALHAKREARWIASARAGDGEAFDALVRLHFAPVYSLLFRLVGNHEDAEDLAQDCFVKAQRALKWYRAEASFGTWIFRIAVSLSRDHFRGTQRHTARLDAPAQVPAPGSRGAEPHDEAVRKELVRALQAGMERLPHRLKAALVMRTHEGLEYRQIASVLGITPHTARVYVMKARRKLDGWLKPWTDEGTRP